MKNNPKQNIRIHTYRKHVNLTLPDDLVEAAKDNGLNLSRFLESKLQDALNSDRMGPGPGFEPGTQAPQARMLTRLHYPGHV